MAPEDMMMVDEGFRLTEGKFDTERVMCYQRRDKKPQVSIARQLVSMPHHEKSQLPPSNRLFEPLLSSHAEPLASPVESTCFYRELRGSYVPPTCSHFVIVQAAGITIPALKAAPFKNPRLCTD